MSQADYEDMYWKQREYLDEIGTKLLLAEYNRDTWRVAAYIFLLVIAGLIVNLVIG